MLVRADLGFLVVVLVVICIVLTRKRRIRVSRREEIYRLLVLAAEESARGELAATVPIVAPPTTSLRKYDHANQKVDNQSSSSSQSDSDIGFIWNKNRNNVDFIDDEIMFNQRFECRSDYNDNNNDVEVEEESREQAQGQELEDMEKQINGDEDDKVEECSTSRASLNSLKVILTDPDVLDCSICFLPLTIPVFQCDNGHIACDSCCSMFMNVCPSCSLSIGYNRCRAIENVLESIKIPCTNIKYGCKDTSSYNKKHEHELMCIHQPCSCPHPGCDFLASSKLLYLHYDSSHIHYAISFNYDSSFTVPVKNGMKYLVLRERSDKTLFVLNYFAVRSIGNLASIICISSSSVKKGLSYELVASKGDSKIKLESLTECMPRWSEYILLREFLLVPSDFIDRHSLHVRICSGRQGKP